MKRWNVLPLLALLTVVIVGCSQSAPPATSTGAGTAAPAGGMMQDGMAKDSMQMDGMAKEGMSKDGMAKDGMMKNDGMAKDKAADKAP